MIECREISKIYSVEGKKVVALDNVSFTIREGEFVAITGSSGSGKSTLMNVLGCLDSVSGGEYFLSDRNVFSLRSAALSRLRSEDIGFIFQSFNLLPDLTALENVRLPLSYREFSNKKSIGRAKAALKAVGMEKRMSHLPSQLSGGQQQRVSIARAIIGEPKVILADEPTGNLDPDNTREVLALLKKQSREGKIVVMVTHDMDIAKSADRVINLRHGKIDLTI